MNSEFFFKFQLPKLAQNKAVGEIKNIKNVPMHGD